jgi:two-component system response regulator RegX3
VKEGVKETAGAGTTPAHGHAGADDIPPVESASRQVSDQILLVEDEPAIADAIAYTLTAAGYEVTTVGDAESALQLPLDDYALVVLDLMLPRLSGLEACRRIRLRDAVPILILTARTGEIDCVLGLEAGADDYVTKPFSTAELVSRIRALLRRRSLDQRSAKATRRQAGLLSMDLADQTVRVEGRLIEVSPSEFRILALLATAPGRAFTRSELAERAARSPRIGGDRTCDVHVKNLRRKIERDPSRPERLVTVRGVGYMLRE